MNPSPYGQPQMQMQRLSNEIEDFAEGGGLYPGGTGIVVELSYRLWDYNGTKPKDSFCAAFLKFQPTDGSNEGKPVEQYYNVGSSSDFLPDPTGGYLMSLRGKSATKSTIWGHFLDALRKNCGLEKGRLSGENPPGIRAMERGVMTLVKVDQPKYEGMDELPPTPGQEGKKKFPKTMLVATRATFTWDPNYARVSQGGQMAQAPAQHMAPPPVPQQQYTPPPPSTQQMAPVNSSTMPPANSNGDYTLGSVIGRILARSGGSISLAGGANGQPPSLANQILAEVGANLPREARLDLVKASKDPNALAQLAAQRNWTLAGDDLIG